MPGSLDYQKKSNLGRKPGRRFSTFFLNKYGGLNFLLKCNYNEKFLRQINLPHFYKSMLQHFLELKVAYNCAIGQDLVLFNNKEILIENQTIFYKECFRKESSLFRTFYTKMANFLHSGVHPKVWCWMQLSKVYASCFRDS